MEFTVKLKDEDKHWLEALVADLDRRLGAQRIAIEKKVDELTAQIARIKAAINIEVN